MNRMNEIEMLRVRKATAMHSAGLWPASPVGSDGYRRKAQADANNRRLAARLEREILEIRDGIR